MELIYKTAFFSAFLFVSFATLAQSTVDKNNPPRTIAFYLQDRVEILDFAGPLEVFAYAGYHVFTVSKSEEEIKAQGILTVKTDYTLKNAPKADILAFFGGNASSAYNDPDVIAWIKQQTDVDFYFSVCTGAFLLAEAGILNNKAATTFHDSLDDLEAKYPAIDVRRDVRFVDNGKIITTAGISAGIDGALHLVAKLQGISAAKRTAYYMEYDNWVPGDGLTISGENIYNNLPTKHELQEYSGSYEYKDGEQMVIETGARNGELHANINGKKYLLFSEKKDIFSDTNGDLFYFQRDKNHQISSYMRDLNGPVFKKGV